jgi:hypothetical protein
MAGAWTVSGGCGPQVSLLDHLFARISHKGDGWVTALPRYCDGVSPVYIRYCSVVHQATRLFAATCEGCGSRHARHCSVNLRPHNGVTSRATACCEDWLCVKGANRLGGDARPAGSRYAPHPPAISGLMPGAGPMLPPGTNSVGRSVPLRSPRPRDRKSTRLNSSHHTTTF